jgi:hypothetical protein
MIGKKVEAIETQERMPLVARFATIEYDLEEIESAVVPHATILPPEKTSPTTYSATTKNGDDNDKDDTGND